MEALEKEAATLEDTMNHDNVYQSFVTLRGAISLLTQWVPALGP